MADKNLSNREITIQLKPLLVAQDEAGKFVVTQDAEAQLAKIFEAKDLIDAIIEHVKDVLGEEMGKRELIKIDGERFKAVKMFHGARFEIVDRNTAQQAGLAVSKQSVVPDPKAIEDAIKKNGGKLPEGIKLRERVATVTISDKTKKADAKQIED